MKKETKDIVALTEKWLEKISDITIDYQKAIQSLAKAQSEYNVAKAIMAWLLPIVTLVVAFLLSSFLLQHTCPNPISIRFQGLEITQQCNTPKANTTLPSH